MHLCVIAGVCQATAGLTRRQKERRADIQSVLQVRGYERVLDMTEAEASGLHMEGTGAFVLDRINGVAYVALSERADIELARQWVQAMGYRVGHALTPCMADSPLLTRRLHNIA